MKMVFPVLVFFVGGLWQTEALISVTGVLGKVVTINCSHSNAFSNVKYFCKGQCDNGDILIRSGKKEDSNAKYSIKDNGNTFYVTISDLTQDDVGTYWCGIERTGVDTYNKVVLTVTEENIDDPDHSEKLVYVQVGLGVVTFALMIIVLLFLRHRKKHISASSGKDHDATLSSQKQDTPHVTTSSSSASKDEETDGRTENICQHQDTSRDHKVSSEAQIKPDGLFYTTVSFNKQPVTPHAELVTYSTIAHKSTDESIIYCNV